jgi:hypothetical protein
MKKNKTPPTDSITAIIELYKRVRIITLIRENLKLTAEQRLQNLQRFAEELREAGKKLRKQD